MVVRQLQAAVLLCVVLRVAAEGRKSLRGGTTAQPSAEQLPPIVKQASQLELTNATLAKRLREVASPEKCIIFTTTSAFLPPLLNMTRNWFAHVHKCARSAVPLPVRRSETINTAAWPAVPEVTRAARPSAWATP